MPNKGFKKEAMGKFGNLMDEILQPDIDEDQSRKKKGGRPRGSTKSKSTAKNVRDKILARFRIDEFLQLVDTDPRVKRYFYLELIPKMLPRLTEKEVEEKFGVTFKFGEQDKKENNPPKLQKETEPVVETPLIIKLQTAPKPEGL